MQDVNSSRDLTGPFTYVDRGNQRYYIEGTNAAPINSDRPYKGVEAIHVKGHRT